MGRGSRWLGRLWGGKKHVEKNSGDGNQKPRQTSSGNPSGKEILAVPSSVSVSGSRTHSYRDAVFFAEIAEKEHNMHAIAVAAATMAATDAAVAAAQAAAAVVRLTTQSRNQVFSAGRERQAATTIQTMFRGFLARKALRALKGLVKLQAHVRGYLVRREAFKTLHRIQALLRAQTAVRMRKAPPSSSSKHPTFHGEPRRRRLIEQFDRTRSSKMPTIHIGSTACGFKGSRESLKIVEMDSIPQKSRRHRRNPAIFESFTSFSPYELSPRHPPAISASSTAFRSASDRDVPGDRQHRSATAHNTPRSAGGMERERKWTRPLVRSPAVPAPFNGGNQTKD